MLSKVLKVEVLVTGQKKNRYLCTRSFLVDATGFEPAVYAPLRSAQSRGPLDLVGLCARTAFCPLEVTASFSQLLDKKRTDTYDPVPF